MQKCLTNHVLFFLGIVSFYFCISGHFWSHKYNHLFRIFIAYTCPQHFFATLKIRIPIIRSLWNRATCYQLFNSYFTCSLHICKFMQWYVAGRDFLYLIQVFSFFVRKKLVAAKPGKVKIVLFGKMFYFCW